MRVLVDAPVRAEPAHPGDVEQGLAGPGFGVSGVRARDLALRVGVGTEVGQDEITVLGEQRVDEPERTRSSTAFSSGSRAATSRGW